MSVRKRVRAGRITWLADYFDQQGKRHNKTFGTKKEADSWLAQTKIDVEKGTHVAATATLTVEQAGEEWIADGEREGLERSTLDSYRQHLRLHIAPHIGRMKLADLRPAHIQLLRGALSASGASRSMANRVVGSLGALLACAMAHEKVGRNVVRDMKRANSGRQRRLEGRHKRRLEVGVEIPAPEEIRKIMEAAEGRWKPLLWTAILTGLRASELRGLSWSDIDLEAETLTVRQRADRWKAIGSPKSEAGKRKIPLASKLVLMLKEWKLACPKGPLNLVFPNTTGGVQDLNAITRWGLAPLQRKLGITDDRTGKYWPKYTLHAFRHAAASLMIAGKWDAKRIQIVLGHSSIQMTFDTYGHLMPQPASDREMMNQLQLQVIGER